MEGFVLVVGDGENVVTQRAARGHVVGADEWREADRGATDRYDAPD